MESFYERTPENERQIREFEAELLRRPLQPGDFRCVACRWAQSRAENEHPVYRDHCTGCGTDKLEDLVLAIAGRPTRANLARTIATLEGMAAKHQSKKKAV